MRVSNVLCIAAVVICVVALTTPAARAADTGADQSLWSGKPATEGGCSAIADCDDGSHVTCSGDTTCTSIDSSCPASRGYVRCDGITKYCTPCPACSLSGSPCSTDAACRLEPGCDDCNCVLPFKVLDPAENIRGICSCP